MVRLTDERLEHLREHPEVHGFESMIPIVMRSPALVIESVRDPFVWLYYRELIHPIFG